MGRRSLLKGSLAALALSPLLQSCGDPGLAFSGVERIPAPDDPIRWDLSKNHEIIESGLTPEAGTTLRIYNYADYLSPRVLKNFEKKYDIDIRLSTFNDADEALTKIATGNLDFDLYFPSYDSIGRLITADLLRPLNQDYLANTPNLWEGFRDPWYDRGGLYTRPYTIYSTGIGWRTDRVAEEVGDRENPYDVLWDTQYKGDVAILDDWHTAMGMVLLRNGLDMNSTDEGDIATVREQLLELGNTMDPQVTIGQYTDIPGGKYGLSQTWSGDAINMQYYLPEDGSVEDLRYWFPEDGNGGVDNDLVVCLAQGKNPVAAHVFINDLLDEGIAETNFGFTGYQPPLTAFTPETLVENGYVPKNLERAVVTQQDFETGTPLLQLPVIADVAYHQIWQEFKAGG